MHYRNDHDAALMRIAALERELARVRRTEAAPLAPPRASAIEYVPSVPTASDNYVLADAVVASASLGGPSVTPPPTAPPQPAPPPPPRVSLPMPALPVLYDEGPAEPPARPDVHAFWHGWVLGACTAAPLLAAALAPAALGWLVVLAAACAAGSYGLGRVR